MKKLLIILPLFFSFIVNAQKPFLKPVNAGTLVQRDTLNSLVAQSPQQIVSGGTSKVDTLKFTGVTPVQIPVHYVYRSTGSAAYGDSNLVFDTTLGAFGINRKIPAASLEVGQPRTAFAGTVLVTSAGTTVTGLGTFFRQTARQGDSIQVGSDKLHISSVNSNISITVSGGTFSSTQSGVAYSVPSLSRNYIWKIQPNGHIYYSADLNLGNHPLLTTSGKNLFIANDGSLSITTGTLNTSVGTQSGASITTGANNSYFGNNVGAGTTTQSNNTAMGVSAYSAGTGSSNTAIGQGAIGGGVGVVSTAANMTAVGASALLKGGANSTAIGTSAGVNNQGTGNVFLGYLSGGVAAVGNFTGSGNLILGTSAGLNYNSANAANIFNTIWIINKNNADSTASTTALTGINITAPTSTLHVNGSFATAYVAKTGAYTATATDHTINCTSGTFTVTLPTAASIAGRQYTVVNSGSGTITIGTTSSQTFVNITSAPTTLTLGAVGAAAIVSYTVASNGANWIVINKVKNE